MYFQLTNLLSIIILVAFTIRTIRNTIYHLFLWQNKEYRLDRMLIHVRTKEGIRFLFGPFSLIKLLLLVIFSVAVFGGYSLISMVSIWLYGGVVLLEAIKNLKEFYSQSLPLPIFSVKIIVVFLIALFLQLVFVVASSPRLALDYLPFLDKSLGAIIAIQIGLFSIPARIKNGLVQMLAREKLNRNLDLKVVGITGSYGKTSTKEFIVQLLEQNFSVVKTPSNTNTAIGVANTILKEIRNDTDYFVMEAAAYKRGEIREITGLVANKLQIAVLTGINAQHLEMFKSLENIEAAKYELVEGLGDKGIAIFNANNPRTRKLSQKARRKGVKILLYGKDKRLSAYATNVKQTPRKLEFTIHLSTKKAKVTAAVLGKHNIENILAAAVVAFEAGVAWEKIVKGIGKIKPPRHTMNYLQKDKTILIDDGYTANPDGVKAALQYLSTYSISKVIVLNPLVELGGEAKTIHKELGKIAGEMCDAIVLTNKNHYDSFMAGITLAKRDVVVVVKNGADAKEFIEDNWKGKKVILFEGRGSEGVLREYIKP